VAEWSSPHVADEDIDAYWSGRLDAAGEERLELHVLECEDCRRRAQAVEELRHGLRLVAMAPARARVHPAWRVAAAVLAAFSILAASQWWSARSELADARTATGREAAVVVPGRAAAVPLLTVRLAPPTRDAQATIVRPADGVTLFEVDAREAGPPGTRYDVALLGPAGTRVVEVRGVVSSEAGVIQLPVAAAGLQEGPYVIELHGGPDVVGFPLVIQP
jgi:anti-sigma factor RsiW